MIDDPVYRNLKEIESMNYTMLASDNMSARDSIANSQNGVMNCIRMIENGTMPENMYNYLKGKNKHDLGFEFIINYNGLAKMIKDTKGNYY